MWDRFFGSVLARALLHIVLFNCCVAFNDFSDEDYNTAFPNHEDEGSLKMVVVMFRHGNRTPDGEEELYPRDPYLNKTYFPYGLGQLTNAGKRKQYLVGLELRKRYDRFLGDYYYPQLIDARSTHYNRTKMSLELVLAGLFPPRKEDEVLGMPWQPVPYNYFPVKQDDILLGSNCPKYSELYKKYTSRPSVQEKFMKHGETFKYISEHTGLNITTFKGIYNLHFGLSTEEEFGLKLPDWTKSVWPEPMTKLFPEEYYIAMGTADMRRIAIGNFLKKLLDDTKAKIADHRKLGRKMYLYSAHESTLSYLMIALRIFEKHIPTYGAYVAMELHQIRGVYGFKIFYKKWDGSGLRLVEMPGCKEFCPLDVFTALLADNLPTSDNMCGN
ncbi:venom acid phosphatase Acph-1-like [Diabrotica virgifera virgifera]|uniref:acid phosphatase n=1 Tax=Diabrotica virgifera virgifera TaxID=50390 RepID=A0ABM5JK36_DIAVI|nr:venom acid phosphatase Acph-1-like [Diabrotica virgifera virgifera]